MHKKAPRSIFGVAFLAVALGLAGCSGKDAVSPVEAERQAIDDLRTEIREVINDPEREQQAVALVDLLSEDLDALRASLSESKERLRALNADYDAPRAKFETYLDESSERIRRNRAKLAQHRRHLIAVTTAEEWTQLSKVRTKAMKAAIKSYQAI